MKQQQATQPKKERTGWWKFARAMQDKEELWGTTTGWVWLTILNNTNYDDSTCEGRKVERGQCIISVRGLAEELHVTRASVVASLNYLERNDRIRVEKGVERKFSVVTVLNWNRYQGDNDDLKNGKNTILRTSQGTSQGTSQQKSQHLNSVAGLKANEQASKKASEQASEQANQRSIKNSKESTTNVVPIYAKLSEDYIADEHIEAEGEPLPKPRTRAKGPACPYQEIADLYNQTCTNLSPAKSISSTQRRRLLYNAWRWAMKAYPNDTMGKLREICEKSNADEFMQRTQATIDRVLSRSNIDRREEQREGLVPSSPKGRRPASALEANMELIARSNEWSKQEVERIRRELAEMEQAGQPAPDCIEVQYDTEEAY